MNKDKLLVPFWEGNEVFDESIMLLSENGSVPSAPLFYTPEKILSITSTDYKTEYKEGKDWVWRDGRIFMVEGSEIP